MTSPGGLLLLTIISFLPRSAQAQPTIARSVLGSGPTLSSSGTTVVAATLGQPVIGLTQQDQLGVYQGFWGGALLKLSVETPPLWSAAEGIALAPAMPNPFAAETTSWLSLPRPTHVTATLHDGLGRELVLLLDGEYEGGQYPIRVEGSALSSGVYYIRVVADGSVRTISVVLDQ